MEEFPHGADTTGGQRDGHPMEKADIKAGSTAGDKVANIAQDAPDAGPPTNTGDPQGLEADAAGQTPVHMGEFGKTLSIAERASIGTYADGWRRGGRGDYIAATVTHFFGFGNHAGARRQEEPEGRYREAEGEDCQGRRRLGDGRARRVRRPDGQQGGASLGAAGRR